MTTLVTGGAGYIGSVIVELLVARGDEVAVLDNLWRGHRSAVEPAARFYEVDLRDGNAVDAVFAHERPTAVVHLGAATVVPESVRKPGLYYEVNTVGSANLLRSIRTHEVGRVVFSSTAAVYGTLSGEPIAETAVIAPISPYGSSKRMVEVMLADAAHADGLRYAALRYFNVAGATDRHGEDHDPETHLVPSAIFAALGRRPALTLFGTDYPTPDGTCIRDYVHVADLAEAHLAALDRLDSSLGPINLGSHHGYSVREVIHAVERVTGQPVPIELTPGRAGDAASLVADPSRALELLGWRPTRPLDEIVASACRWHLGHPDGYPD